MPAVNDYQKFILFLVLGASTKDPFPLWNIFLSKALKFKLTAITFFNYIFVAHVLPVYPCFAVIMIANEICLFNIHSVFTAFFLY
jgi:hypothetical protein